MLREIKGTQRLPRLLAFKVTGTGTAAINEGVNDAVLVDNGTGDYTLTFAKPFARTPVVNVSIQGGATTLLARIHALSATAVQIKLFAVDGTTATDGIFHAQVIGWDTADQY